MKIFYEFEFKTIAPLAKGATIVNVEHNEDADEGLILTLDTGTKLVFGWSGEMGSCDVVLGHPSEILKVDIAKLDALIKENDDEIKRRQDAIADALINSKTNKQ